MAPKLWFTYSKSNSRCGLKGIWSIWESFSNHFKIFIQIFHQETQAENLLSLLDVAAVYLHRTSVSSSSQSYPTRFFSVTQSLWFSPERSVVYRYNTRGCYSHITCLSYSMNNSSLSRECQNKKAKSYTDFFWQLSYSRKHHRISGNLAVMTLSHNECIIKRSKQAETKAYRIYNVATVSSAEVINKLSNSTFLCPFSCTDLLTAIMPNV